ncbi:hypothetical protein HYC85_001037 [Camellia sinensis]|uniref:Uncharacterized protein n=1 Tax=Camellia sinensis TaxID=4442 RepID=A0A7J7I6R5_CAMSI|nr:hypothetical protein HYC85_001037 [Camellia sinensis]
MTKTLYFSTITEARFVACEECQHLAVVVKNIGVGDEAVEASEDRVNVVNLTIHTRTNCRSKSASQPMVHRFPFLQTLTIVAIFFLFFKP